MTLLELQQVSKSFLSPTSETKALANITATIQAEEFVSLIGPSGCGKSTLLSLIAGMTQATAGSISLYGKPITGPSKEVGYMLQQDYLFPWLTVWENIMLGLTLQHMQDEKHVVFAENLLQDVYLSDKKDVYPDNLSGGMKQRVALIRMLTSNPSLLLLDEPFSAIDHQTKLQLEQTVASIVKQHKKTTLLVTHDILEALAMSDRIILLSRRPGTIQKIFDVPESLRSLPPLEARLHPDAHSLFTVVWKEMMQDDNTSSISKEARS
ncbi:ABC transporter ATP-binding protein [Paenalkalicoccus suaedae]|uniref:ABC transporter ATP-binding protein n=1 Tax=Paenalkalicoccus suaedae TaxID=2592382 RepID=A0A859FH58_9BACI|nr:ABC transporter ATP-binding protein [Paenalkalicoccus suaedae]QKS72130.1 ABC transporter ATP-binding protein [Paenalkalicoccus suaedae]